MQGRPPRTDQGRAAALVGLGETETGKVYGRTARDFAAEAVRRAAADAGLRLADLDGLLVASGLRHDLDLTLANALGLTDLRLLSQVNAFGATAGAMVQYAAEAVLSGAAVAVACVFADAPLRPGKSTGVAYSTDRPLPPGLPGLRAAAGVFGVNTLYALAARRHMEAYGTTSEQLGAIAVQQRAWAVHNPRAQMRDPLTLADHQASRWIAEPLHLLDCCLVSNGGTAVIVTSPERAADLPAAPVYIWGYGQGHPGNRYMRGSDFGLRTGAAAAGPAALAMAGIGLDDIGMLQLYDCYTFTVLVTLEDYGFCKKGEGGDLAASGILGPGGSLPTNTGGGQLSASYLWGMTPLAEAVNQLRGRAEPERLVRDVDFAMVSGNGGILDHHSTLILSGHDRRTAGRP
ncbi:thiolase family protein [Yinghuangia soli]|uniref:Thiolase family protein n=1 Tax=Yinghuangia soli TaxID=2908204 RepID=A0AA41PWM9_9ACTN|nr:thiolase family protein [Yinghuangia soli]MCF2525927.1 thiolase family protein [Yinghuangia soli]